MVPTTGQARRARSDRGRRARRFPQFRPRRQLHGRARAPAARRRVLEIARRRRGADPGARSRGATHVTADWLAERVVGRNIDGHLLCPSGLLAADEYDQSAERLRLHGKPIRRASAARSARTCAGPIRATASRKTWPRRRPCSTPRTTTASCGAAANTAPTLADRNQDDGAERGLLFICLNTDIARQFEFVQQTWLLNKNFAHAVRRDRPARRARRPLHHPRGAAAADRRSRDLRPVGGRRILLPAEHSGAELSGSAMSATASARRAAARARRAREGVGDGMGHGDHPAARLSRAAGVAAESAPRQVVVATRYDEVREVFLNDRAFRRALCRQTRRHHGRAPFFLGMDDTTEYRRDTEAMRKVIRTDDIPDASGPRGRATRRSRSSPMAGGRLEVVDAPGAADHVRALSASISAFLIRPAGTCASGRPGCSNSSSPTRATTRRCGPRST